MLSNQAVHLIFEKLTQVQKLLDKGDTASCALINECLEIISGASNFMVAVDTKGMTINSTPMTVKFKQTLFEESFIEPGMMATINRIFWSSEDGNYVVEVSYKGFDLHNIPLMIPAYYPSHFTKEQVRKGLLAEQALYTAIQANVYSETERFFMSPSTGFERNDEQMFADLIDHYFDIVEPSKD